MSEAMALKSRRFAILRGQILRMVYRCQRQRDPAPNHVELWGALRRLMYRVSRNDVRDTLEDLRDRGYVTFELTEDPETGHELMGNIRVSPKGRDLVQGNATDPAIEAE